MENFFHKETDGIYRLRVPFDNIYTSVFLIIANEKRILVDCATTSDDVDGYIVPALTELGYTLSDVDIIVISHKHGDHAGGIERVKALAPEIEVVKGVEVVLADGISTYSLAGHTVDCIGVLDERTATLITADGLQGAGVDKYRCSIKYRTAYIDKKDEIWALGEWDSFMTLEATAPGVTVVTYIMRDHTNKAEIQMHYPIIVLE